MDAADDRVTVRMTRQAYADWLSGGRDDKKTQLDGGEIGVTITPKFETKDSGDRVEYDSGMVRDTNGGKPRWDLMIPKGVPYEELYLTRVARLYERGAQKYEPRNWEKANSQEELDRALESAFRHFMQWFAGETDEDHAAAVFFNINEVETIRSKQSRFVAEFNDRDRSQDILQAERADTW